MIKKVYISIVVLLTTSFLSFSQTTLPVNRTTWNAGAPLGWTDNGTGSYTSSFACSGNNMGQLNSTGDFYQVFFTGAPNTLTFKLKSASMNAASFCLVEESPNGVAWSTIGTYGPGNTPITDCANISLGLAGTTRYVKWTYTKGSGNCGIDDVTISVSCTPATEPATNASAYTFSNIGCNGIQISWASPAANDSSLVVVKAGSDVTTDPIDGTPYTANSTFGSGTDIGTSEFVVYDGSGTSVIVTGLTASTTYYFNIFEYNGESTCIDYRTSDEISSSVATVSCDTCAHLTAALINSCDNLPCTEGDNEMLFLNSGNYYVNTSAAGITMNYGSTSPAPNTYADSFTANPTQIGNMNADPGCAGTYIDASTVSSIPPNSTFLILNETVCADAFDWSTMCSATTGNIYVFFSSDATWTSFGQFSNSPPALPKARYFRTIIEGCTIDYSYDSLNFPSGDGAIAYWNTTGGAASSYGSDGCTLPATVLPITLLYFNGKALENGTNLLEWSTSAEINNDYFTIEKSTDAFNFNEIGTVQGAGNSNTQQYYQLIDDNPFIGINYYRLQQTDFDGAFSYSEIIAINTKFESINVFVSNDNTLTVNLNNDSFNGTIEILDITGRRINQFSISENKKINLNYLSQGIYIYRVKNSVNSFSEKFIIR